MISYGKTDQFRQVVKNITSQTRFIGVDENGKALYDGSIELPKVTFKGTVKLHGTNASIVMRDGEFTYQSKNNELGRHKDNAGFCNAMMDLEHTNGTISRLFSFWETQAHVITIFGEWAGNGIQKGVGVSELDKAFYIFAIKIGEGEDSFFVDMSYGFVFGVQCPSDGIYNLWDTSRFPVYSMEVDIAEPLSVTQELEDITLAVEEECPIANSFGAKGIGEGVVWVSVDAEHRFKVKGTKHSDTKVKKLVTVDPQVMADIKEFVNNTTTAHRFEKGIDFLKEEGKELVMSSTGAFVKWATNDIMSEEQDTIIASKLDRKYIPAAIAKAASRWYITYINKV